MDFIKQSRKGFTLAEMCIVLALVAVISLSVISFSTLTGARGKTAAQRLGSVQELGVIEDLCDEWIEIMTEKGAVFTASQTGLSAQADGNEYTFNINQDLLKGTLPDGRSMSDRFTYIKEIGFEKAENAEDEMFFCTVNYEFDGEIKEYVFCVNLHIGETFTVETGAGV